MDKPISNIVGRRCFGSKKMSTSKKRDNLTFILRRWSAFAEMRLFTQMHKSYGELKEWTQGVTEKANMSPVMTF